jgi:AAA15 family ATPase/GTPase
MDITSLKDFKPIDVLGLKNFRIFDDQKGFLEDLAAINILTGANNSGKSSIIKSLQMLRNSIREYKYPFALDLNQQEHLLGDFDNILLNKSNRHLEITLPYLFMGMKDFSISLTFEPSTTNNAYDARLRGIEVIDRSTGAPLFSFRYRSATEIEKTDDNSEYVRKKQEFEQKKAENRDVKTSIFDMSNYIIEPYENQLEGYVEWYINIDRLKHFLEQLIKVYEIYLADKRNWTGDGFREVNRRAKDLYIIPSLFVKSFKDDADLEKWKNYVDTLVNIGPDLSGEEKVGERDFDADDFFLRPPAIEDVLFYKASEILRANLKWEETDGSRSGYSVMENSFRNAWDILLQRISTINYVSNIKEENARSYNASSNSPFIRLLKSFAPQGYYGSEFMRKYLRAFEIGKEISVKLDPKYQSILASITTLDGKERELVDFGYGIKQLVLILMQISVLAQNNKKSEHVYDDHYGEIIEDTYVPSLLIIEEPESNLHPKWQSLLAEMFAEANSSFNIQMIIETHSEYLIRKFQTLVANKTVPTTNIKIFYLRSVDKVKDGKKQVESLHIQDDGTIDFNVFDHGFFDENYNLQMSLLNIQRDKFLQDFENLKKSSKETEDKLAELQQKIDAYTDKVDVAKYERMVAARFDTAKLLTATSSYLVSGQYLLENIDPSGDYSPVIIQYGRAIENELKRIFSPILNPKECMLGPMQTQLQNYLNGNAHSPMLPGSLATLLNAPLNIRVDLIDNLRLIRNDAGHAGHTKTKQDALGYIGDAELFLDRWIAELK